MRLLYQNTILNNQAGYTLYHILKIQTHEAKSEHGAAEHANLAALTFNIQSGSVCASFSNTFSFFRASAIGTARESKLYKQWCKRSHSVHKDSIITASCFETEAVRGEGCSGCGQELVVLWAPQMPLMCLSLAQTLLMDSLQLWPLEKETRGSSTNDEH